VNKVSSVLPLQQKNIVNEVAKLLYYCTYMSNGPLPYTPSAYSFINY